MVTVAWSEVRARRLARSWLSGSARAGDVVDVARGVCGVHAQVQASAELQLGARVSGLVQSDVREALWERRVLVKAWTIRGTLHLHPGAELAVWFAARRAVAAGGGDGLEPWVDTRGVIHPPLDADEVESVQAAVWDALDGRCLRREELVEAVSPRVSAAARGRMGSGFAFFLGDLCQGPPQGSKVTFVRPDQWIEGWKEIDGRDALKDACRRYLQTYGPARPTAFREWFGGRSLSAGACRDLFESLSDELEEVEVEGHLAYVIAGDTMFSEGEPSVRLLPEYDVYVMGFRERDQLVSSEVKELIAAHGRGRYEGPAGVRLVIVDGVAVGLWERVKRGKRLELNVALVRKLTRAQHVALASEAETIGRFLRLEPTLTVETLSR